MENGTQTYLANVQGLRKFTQRWKLVLPMLSLLVVLVTFWGLKLTGITMAGDAFCGKTEHSHTEQCQTGCELEEHVHDQTCYSNVNADLETEQDWVAMLEPYNQAGSLAQRVVQVARSQIGYQESTLNFQVDGHGVRRGITRYGQWYENPYGDWSAMFASFCLHYAGIEETPAGAGPEAMLLAWQEAGLYGDASSYAPAVGQLLFLDKNENGSADAVAIITDIAEGNLQVVEGNLNDAVAETTYEAASPLVLGYGRVPLEPQLTLDAEEGNKLVAQTESDRTALFTDGNQLVVYLTDETGAYAVDGYGNLVAVEVDENGNVFTSSDTPELLLWSVVATDEEGGYRIENVVTGLLLPEAPGKRTRTPGDDYQYARAVNYTVWLDGTNGGMMSYAGSLNQRYTVVGGTTITLPETWQSPTEYSYKIRGWFDIVNNVYYEPGTEVPVNENLVFYADWIAGTYDIGQFNSFVSDTVSTDDFVTTRMFDYGVLFNMLSSYADVTFNNNSHSESWHLITSGNSPYSGAPTLGYIFRDWDAYGKITYPNGVNNPSANYPTDSGSVYRNLYTDQLGQLLFDPNTEVIGKLYLGTADHLFHLNTNPADEHYGYHYYDSKLHAASYNQSDQRFYVYDYLSQTSDSATTEGEGKYSDFLPFNSPYANTNGRNPTLYQYEGVNGMYNGVNHYMYDAKDSSASNVATNYFFGMSVDIRFYLPNVPGSGGNHDLYGKDMHFKFSGDDDVWVFVDGKMVLDLGGIHGTEAGDVNFSTGEVTINGVRDEALSNVLVSVGAGEHTLTLYYLERGSSLSNCAIYFNLAPRFKFSIQKEDFLTKEILNGAQFSVFTDEACTVPAQLWTSKESYDNGDAPTHVFTVVDGIADMWGMGASNTYYIKETKPPDAIGYGFAHGVIRLVFDKTGTASYNVDIIDGGEGISNGFTVHGFRIDEETQEAFIVATNAPTWVTETTEVLAHKVWNDPYDHSGDTVTVYLTVTDPDGTVRRLQEAILSSENSWAHQWTNLPKFASDGVTPIQYGVEEAYVSGYYSKTEAITSYTLTTTTWQQVTGLEHGKTYLLKTANGCLSTLSNASDTGYQWVSEQTAKNSPLALWTVTVSGGQVKFTNGAGQTLTFYYNGGSPTDFFASTGGESNASKQYFRYSSNSDGLRLYYDATNGQDYYLISSMTGASKFNYSTNQSSGLVFTPITKVVTSQTITPTGWAYEITNTPLEEETSVTVNKVWDYGYSPLSKEHEKLQVTIRLLANGKDTGRTVTLTLKNGWTDTFRGLPYTDSEGKVIVYTVQESWDNPDWIPHHGEIQVIDGEIPTYSTTVTNVYRWGTGAELPSTGTRARMVYTIVGCSILLATLVVGIVCRRKRERGIQ